MDTLKKGEEKEIKMKYGDKAHIRYVREGLWIVSVFRKNGVNITSPVHSEIDALKFVADHEAK